MDGGDLRRIRLSLGLTQRQLSEIMGYSGQAYIAKLEAGTKSMSPQGSRLLEAYCRGYRPDDWPV